MAIHNILGQKGEEIAEEYLRSKKYEVAAKNWRFKKMEIDIIAFYDNKMIVVEVKTRTSEYVENLSEIVTRRKQKFLIEAANAYLEEKNLDCEVRFDIIFIVFQNGKFNLSHIEDAFTPMA